MRATKAIVRQRVEQVLQLRLLAAEFLDIRQYASAQDPPWNVSDRQLWRYIAAADELLVEMLDTNRDRLFARHVGMRRALFARAMSVSDYRTAATVLKDEAGLLRLYDEPSRAAPKTDALPTSASDLVKMFAARLAEVDQANMPATERVRLTTMLGNGFLQAIGAADTNARLQELLDKLSREEQTGTPSQ
jgi:hypothetical protein